MARDLHIQVSDAQADVLLLVLAQAELGVEQRGMEYWLAARTLTAEQDVAAQALQRWRLLSSMSLGDGALKSYGLTTNGRAVAQTVRALREKAATNAEAT